jgi:tetratricopeptide (TPR) repeat protein
VLWTGVRFGLFEVDQGGLRSLRMHRTVQEALRASMMRDGILYDRQAQVLRALAAFAPMSFDAEPERGGDFAELQRHLEPAGVADLAFDELADVLGPAGQAGSHGWQVRRCVVAQVRYLYRQHGVEVARSAKALAEKIHRSWSAAFGPADELCNRLAVQLANLHRALGEYDEALALDLAVLAEQRRGLGLRHPRTLMTARGLGGDLRDLGRYEEALAEDEATWRGFRESFGEDHPETLMVAFNLAISRYLSGHVGEALELAESSYRHRLRVLGEDHRWVWQSRRNVAVYLAELGEYDQALEYLDDNIDRIHRYHETHEHSEELHTARIRLLVERRSGGRRPDRARRMANLLEHFGRRFGPTSADTRACTLSYAVELHFDGGPGHAEQALRLGEECLAALRGRFGERHPLTCACRVNVLLFQRGAGQLERALAGGAEVLADLHDQLDEGHPWPLAAAVNHAGALVAAGEPQAAVELLDSTHRRCLDSLGDRHPTTLAAAENLARGPRRPWRQLDLHLL